MKKLKLAACVIALTLISVLASAQTSAPALNHFAKEGLSFDYPADVRFEEHGDAGGQQLELYNAGNGAQIMVVSRFETIDTPAQLEKARQDVFDFFVDTTIKQFETQQAKVERKEAQIQVGGAQASGVRLRAVLDGEPGNAEAYYVVLGRRLVLVTFIGSDKELAAGAPAWEIVRRTLKVAPTVASLTTPTPSRPDSGPSFQTNERLKPALASLVR
jgi:hypothetical protein